MFDVYCPRHDARVILFSENIELLVNGPHGPEVHWRCPCGEEGVLESTATTAA